MIRQRFATRVTTKRAFVLDLKDDDSKPIEKSTEEKNSTSNTSFDIGTPDIPDVDSNKNENVENIRNCEEDFCTPNSPLNCTGVLNEILKHPPLGTSTPRIAVPQNRSKQPNHYPKSLFRNTSSKLNQCSPIRKYAIIKPSSQIHTSPKKAKWRPAEDVPITAKLKNTFSCSYSSTKTVSEQSVTSPVKEVQDVPVTPNSQSSDTCSASPSPEVPIQNKVLQESVKSVTASEPHRSTKSKGLRSPKVNKIAKLRPRSALSSPISIEIPALKSQKEKTPSESRIKHISLSKSAIKQVSIDSESPIPEASQGTKSEKKSKGTKSKNKVPREVKLLMEQCYKMENLKSHYHADTGEVEFEQYTRSHKPVCYNVDTMLAKFDKQSVPKKRIAKSQSDVYNFSGCTVGKKGQPKPPKSSKSPKKKTTSKSKKNIPEDSGNSSSSFNIKRKKSATKVISDDDDGNIFIQKKRKVSKDSDSGYCKETGGTKDPKKKPNAVRSKRSLYTRNYDDFDYDISPSTSTTSNENHFVKSMKHLVKKTDFRKMRKTSKKS
ncbi:hypothetical protein LOTGIDRAFT_229596 [Lottia gigantea]|uniref:Uncharacterized protein n=1 Tax=Lottia gigantea TaxID=225164 RepID=V3ZT62_LOTGI|nr:hypothetical protein LOTGIDRAFT_229596 [Lottia gigantea]ESO84086.1 hypothetical protein LOTGIDRAFT_229596 [Lottia gigantea]